MTDKKFTDEEIKKALERACSANNICNECPVRSVQFLAEKALALIDRYEAEIKRLEGILNTRCEHCPRNNTTLVKEFAERLTHTLVINNEENTEYFDFAYTLETIDAVKKEVMEGNC